jgi:hypothetical protein
MSYASDHPVHCARREDLGCEASFPGSRSDRMRAGKAGWFLSRESGKAYCPAHVPEWADAWRARKAAEAAARDPELTVTGVLTPEGPVLFPGGPLVLKADETLSFRVSDLHPARQAGAGGE